jgi:hypothetical protein
MNRIDPDDTESLKEEANAARAKLMRTVEALDLKAHRAINVRLQLRKHIRGIATAGIVLGLAAAGTIALVTYRFATRGKRKRHARVRMLRRVWEHPERAARGDGATFWSRLARSVALTLLTAAISKPLRAAMMRTRMLPESDESERHARVAG